MFKVLGVVLVLLAVGLAVVPTFTDCQSQGSQITLANGTQIPMKCHWTGIAEIGVAVPMVVVGGMMTIGRRKHNLMNLSVVGIALAGMAIAFPAGLIGVCATPTHTCVTAMKPALVSLGSLAAAVGLVGAFAAWRGKDA